MIFSLDRCHSLLTGFSPATVNCGDLASPLQSAYKADRVTTLQPIPMFVVQRGDAWDLLALTRASSFSSQQVSLTSLHRGHTGHLSPIHAPSSGLSRKFFLPVCASLTLNHSSAQGLLEKARCTLLTGSAPVLSHACFTCRDCAIFQRGSVSSSSL